MSEQHGTDRRNTAEDTPGNTSGNTSRNVSGSTYENILVETRGRVGIITLNRPRALNALDAATLREVVAASTALDTDPGIGAIVLTGSEKAFAAGADIK